MLEQFLKPKQAENGQAHQTRQIKDWVREILNLTEDSTVMVTELQCTEPGCPPLETVIAVLEAGKEKRQTKMHKMILTITYQHVKGMCEKLERGESEHGHDE